jgi:hypothetical protein
MALVTRVSTKGASAMGRRGRGMMKGVAGSPHTSF